MQELDLTVIADRWCPTSRTYLTYLNKAGYRVRKILLVDFTAGGRRDTLLRRYIGHALSSALIRRTRAAWPNYAPLVKQYCVAVQNNVEHPIDYAAPFDFTAHADIEELVAQDYEDPALHKVIMRQPGRMFLYTNGGRVPAKLLQRDLKFFHIHPGVVPHVRGSDGLLWSIVTRGKPGVSCFYMDPGIDTGPVIATKEFSLPRLAIAAPANDEEEDALYRALLLAYDPHLRASLLCDVIRASGGRNLNSMATTAQTPNPKKNYLWMHPKLRRKVITEMLCHD